MADAYTADGNEAPEINDISSLVADAYTAEGNEALKTDDVSSLVANAFTTEGSVTPSTVFVPTKENLAINEATDDTKSENIVPSTDSKINDENIANSLVAALDPDPTAQLIAVTNPDVTAPFSNLEINNDAESNSNPSVSSSSSSNDDSTNGSGSSATTSPDLNAAVLESTANKLAEDSTATPEEREYWRQVASVNWKNEDLQRASLTPETQRAVSRIQVPQSVRNSQLSQSSGMGSQVGGYVAQGGAKIALNYLNNLLNRPKAQSYVYTRRVAVPVPRTVVRGMRVPVTVTVGGSPRVTSIPVGYLQRQASLGGLRYPMKDTSSTSTGSWGRTGVSSISATATGTSSVTTPSGMMTRKTGVTTMTDVFKIVSASWLTVTRPSVASIPTPFTIAVPPSPEFSVGAAALMKQKETIASITQLPAVEPSSSPIENMVESSEDDETAGAPEDDEGSRVPDGYVDATAIARQREYEYARALAAKQAQTQSELDPTELIDQPTTIPNEEQRAGNDDWNGKVCPVECVTVDTSSRESQICRSRGCPTGVSAFHLSLLEHHPLRSKTLTSLPL